MIQYNNAAYFLMECILFRLSFINYIAGIVMYATVSILNNYKPLENYY